MPIRRKLFLLGLVAIVTVELVGGLTAVRAREAVRNEVRQGLQTIADLQAELIAQQIVLGAQRIQQFTGSVTGMRIAAQLNDGPVRLSPDSARSLLQPLLGRDVRAAAIVTPDAFVVADTSVLGRPVLGLADLDLARLVSRGLAGPNGAVGEVRADDAGGRYDQVIPDRFPAPRFLVLAQISLEPVSNVVRTGVDLGPATSTYLVQRSGDTVRFVTAPRSDLDPTTLPALPLLAADEPAVRAGIGRRSVVETDGDDAVVAATRAVPDTAWGLVTQTERGEAFGGADRLVWAQVIGFVVGGVALAIGTWLLTRSVLARIERLTAGAEALSEGNLEARIGDRGADELGVLARAFDRMADTIAEDVERRTQVESRLDHQARHDPLTGLPNRAELERSLRAVVARRRAEPGSHAALLFCDLDDFKAVNDELGHTIGDELLCTIAARFRGVIGPGDVLARFGGDEFVVLCPNLAAPEAAERLAARLRGALSNPIVLAGREITASVSVGIAPFDPSTGAAQVLKDADAAMYRAKERQRRERSAGAPGRSARHEEIAVWHEAIERNEFTLLFQPIRRLRDRRVVAVEALVRRRQGDHLRLPGEFLGRLEALHLLPTLDRWVLGRATAQLAAWRRAGLPADVQIVVNASPATFDDDRAVARAINTLTGVGLQPENLVIDLPERAIEPAGPGQHHALARLAATGVHIAIDDFGRGAIGIGRLHTVVAKQIKLDRSIVADVDRNDRARATARSLLGLAHDLGLSVVAEGVERSAQADVLTDLGCDLAQGFALGLPVWPDDLIGELYSVRSGSGESGVP